MWTPRQAFHVFVCARALRHFETCRFVVDKVLSTSYIGWPTRLDEQRERQLIKNTTGPAPVACWDAMEGTARNAVAGEFSGHYGYDAFEYIALVNSYRDFAQFLRERFADLLIEQPAEQVAAKGTARKSTAATAPAPGSASMAPQSATA
jgi:hypothetical protein